MHPGSVRGSEGQYSPPRQGLLSDPVQEDIAMNKWRLQIHLQSMEKEYSRPRIEDALPWLATTGAFLLALVPRDFKSFLGFSGDVWTAVALIGSFFFAYQTVRVLWNVFMHRKDKHITAEAVVLEIMDDMRTQQERFQAQQQGRPSLRDGVSTQTTPPNVPIRQSDPGTDDPPRE